MAIVLYKRILGEPLRELRDSLEFINAYTPSEIIRKRQDAVITLLINGLSIDVANYILRISKEEIVRHVKRFVRSGSDFFVCHDDIVEGSKEHIELMCDKITTLVCSGCTHEEITKSSGRSIDELNSYLEMRLNFDRDLDTDECWRYRVEEENRAEIAQISCMLLDYSPGMPFNVVTHYIKQRQKYELVKIKREIKRLLEEGKTTSEIITTLGHPEWYLAGIYKNDDIVLEEGE